MRGCPVAYSRVSGSTHGQKTFMKHAHWHYFAALSEDVQGISRYVEPTQANFKTYSIELARLYLSICSEIDVVVKLLCHKANPVAKLNGINSYRPILAKYQDFPSVEVRIPRAELLLIPWQEWRNGKNPTWWGQYNEVKHERDKFFYQANLENTLNALAGLLVSVGYLYAEDLRDHYLPLSQNFMGFSTKYYSGSTVAGPNGPITAFRLPGIPRSDNDLKSLKRHGISPAP